MIGKLFNKAKAVTVPAEEQSPRRKPILVTHPKSGQRLQTACRKGRIVYTDDSAVYRYIVVWRGEFLPRQRDLYIAFQLLRQRGATFNPDELEWA